ncbi:MAG: histidine phosphatase family protein [Oenococcus sp.]|uniref:histidine phosphatase family protein n=1 Tax=Oenococcus sp. TaxID=1979414 RepID=UPI0039EB0F54
MKRIYFVRHSIRDNRIKNDRKAPLTQQGKKLADALSSYFQDKQIQSIYSSPYLRALETIQPTAKSLQLPITQSEMLRERQSSWQTNWQQHLQSLWADFQCQFPNEENMAQVQKRMVAFFAEAIRSADNNMIICSHGTALSMLFNHLTAGQFSFKDWQSMNMPEVYLLTLSSNDRFVTLEKIDTGSGKILKTFSK